MQEEGDREKFKGDEKVMYYKGRIWKGKVGERGVMETI